MKQKGSNTKQIALILIHRTAKVEKSIDRLAVEFKDFENDTGTKFEQTADSISSKVSKGSVSSEISQEHDKVKITGNRLVVESDNFGIDENGNTRLTGALTLYDKIRLYKDPIYINEQKIERLYDFFIWKITGDVGVTQNYDIKLMTPDGLTILQAKKNIYEMWSDLGISVESLTCRGTKSRTVKTKNYSERLQYCYEMASPMFGDIGHGVVGNDGLCYVDIDSIFAETIDTIQQYYVFLQPYSDKPLFVKEKTENYFVVCGEPNAEFDWEIKAKQSDFPIERLEENSNEGFSDIDYVSSAETYLENYEKELTING